MNGYLGKILRVDLSQGRLWDEALNEDYARNYVGGSGLAARYLYDMLDARHRPARPGEPAVLPDRPAGGYIDDLRRALQRLRPLTADGHLG